MSSHATPYREQALKLLPWICTRCAREFPASRLRELTVHHKDGDHDNNPPDGSNWELLCIYCHENEHARVEDAKTGGGGAEEEKLPATQRPFAGLDELLQKKRTRRRRVTLRPLTPAARGRRAGWKGVDHPPRRRR